MENKTNILIVEDDKESLLFLSDILSIEGYNIIPLENGETALDFLKKHHPDLILLDIILPGINGFEVCRKIKEKKALINIPIIFLSGKYDIEDKLKGFRLGAVDFIPKPFHREELLARINNHIKLSNYNKLFEEKNAEKIIENEQLLRQKNFQLENINTKLKIERRFTQDAIDAQKDTFFVFDPSTGKALRWNKTFEEISGYSAQEIAELKAPDSYYSKEDLTKAALFIEKVYIEGEGIIELDLISKSGKYIPTEYKVSVIYDDNGKISGFISIGRDITERKRNEEKWRRYEYIVSSTSDLMALIDKNYCYLMANKAYANAFGVSQEQIRGKSVPELFGEDFFQNVVKPHIDKCLNGNQIYYQTWINFPALKKRFVDISYSPYYDYRNEIAGLFVNNRDITKLKKAELALEESKNRYERLFNATGTANSIFNKEYKLILNNELSKKELAKNNVTGIGKTVYEIFGNEQGEVVKERLERVFNSGTPEIHEIEFSSGNVTKWFSSNYQPLYDENNSVIAIQIVSADITRHKKAEIEISKLSQGIEESPICVIITDKRGIIEYANKQFYKLTGYQPIDVIGKNPRILNAGTHPKSYYKKMWQTILAGKVWNGEFHNKKANGEFYWEKVIITPIKNKHNQVTHFVALKEDITEKKNLWINLYSAKKRVEESETLFNAFMENVPIFTYIEDKSHKPIYRNSKTWNLFKENDYNPFTTNELFSEEQSNILRKAAEKIFNGESQYEEIEFSTNLNNKLLNNIWLKDIKFPIKLPNGETLLGGMAIDITHEKQAKEKLLLYQNDLEKTVNSRTKELKAANQKLQSINRNLNEQKQVLEQTIKDLHKTQAQLVQSEKMASLGILVAGVAHEINNPVNFIYSSLTGLKNNLDYLSDYINLYKNINEDNYKIILDGLSKKEASLDDIFEMFSKSISIIEVGVNRTTKIVKSLKSFAHSDEKEVSVYNVHENLDNTLLILFNQYKNRIEITKEYHKIPNINCYPGQINQVFMNVLMNAIQSIEDEGTILIKTLSLNEQQIAIEIHDSGSGISPENLKNIFDPFFTTKKVGKGTGLGLSISYNIIKKHHGEISVKSKLGQGTCFTITLPITQ